jgi:hypothetical protein
MVGASDIYSSSAYSTLSSSSSEDEGDHHRSRKSSKNLSGLSCFARDGFCTMALSSGSKKSTQSDSDSDSDNEVRDELPFLREENERLLTVKIRQPSHEFTFGVGISFIPYPLVLTPVV